MRKLFILLMLLVIVCPQVQADEYQELKQMIQQMQTQMNSMAKHIEHLEEKIEHDEHREEDAHVDQHAYHEHEAHVHKEDEKWGPFDTHKHGDISIDRVAIHGGIDVQVIDAEDAEKDAVLQEAQIGIEVELSEWLTGFAVLTKEEGESAAVEEAWGEFHIEEWNLKVKGGKYFVPFGTLNQDEFFARRTITRSPLEEDFFGEEAWIDTGGHAQVLLPEFIDGWKSTLLVGFFNGDNEASFGDDDEDTSEGNNNFPVLVRFQKYYEDDWGSFTGGFSFAHGDSDDAENFQTTMKGLDMALNIGNFNLMAEYIHRDKEVAGNGLVGYGYDISASYTVPLDYKYLEYVEFLFAYGMSDAIESTEKERYAPQLTLGLTENSKMRFLYEFLEEKPTETNNDRFVGQYTYQF